MDNNLTFNDLPLIVSQLVDKINNLEKLFLNNPQTVNTPSDEFLTIRETAKMLDLSVATLYGYVHFKKIPYNKKGKKLYFLKSDILEWLKNGRVKTYEETLKIAETYIKSTKKGSKI